MYRYAQLSDEGRTINISADSVKNFDIFSAEYKNGKGEVTVQSLDGKDVIAPGTGDEYTFRIKNDDDVAIDYSIKPVVKYTGTEKLPLEIRLISPDEEYLIGGPKAWGTFDDLSKLELSGTLDKEEIDSYELEWRWVFERGDDAGDTALGNAPEGIGISVGMEMHSETNLDIAANDLFFKLSLDDMLWWFIFFILLLIAIVLLILSLITKKKNAPEPEPAVVYAPAPAPAPEPIVVPVKAPTKKKEKAKGFVGKMEYVNIDTLVDIFDNGETITLKKLKEKKLVDPEATQVKILARNDMVLNKAFHIETQGISGQARQKVIAAGGSVKIIDG